MTTEPQFLPTLPTTTRLDDRRVLVVGGSSGIGRAIAVALIRCGADVTVVSRRSREIWDDRCPAPAGWLQTNLMHDAEVDRVLDLWVEERRGEVDAVVHGAVSYGVPPRHALVQTELAEWDEIQAVNVRSAFVIMRKCFSALLARPASLALLVSSDVADAPAPGRVAYAASKAALRALGDGLAAELAGSPLRVVQVFPLTQVVSDGIRRRRPAGFDFAGYADPDSFAPIAVTLVRTLGDGVHGARIRIDPLGRAEIVHGGTSQ